MRAILATALPIGLLLSSTATTAQERCLASYYKLPPSIAEDLRPYLLCGLVRERSDTGQTINGVPVSMGMGQGPNGCGDVRARSYAAADRRLNSIRMKPSDRKFYLDVEFKKADEFLRTTTKLDDFGIGEEPAAPRCRTQNASH